MEVIPPDVMPPDVDALSALVAHHSRAGRRLRAVGSRTSFSTLKEAGDGVCVRTDALCGPLPLPPLRPGWDPAGLVRVGAGTTVRSVQLLLAPSGRMLENTPAFTGQTISGAVSTASHGTGRAFGSLADLVVSVDLVVDGGELLRVEAADGPTDPGRHRGDLLQDDALFRAVVVGLGCFGIQAALTLRTTPLLHLREERTVLPLAEALDRISAPTGRHVGLLVNPYPEADGTRLACVTERFPCGPARGLDRFRARQRPWPRVFSALPLERPLLAAVARDPERGVPWMLGSALRATARPRFVGPAPVVMDNHPLNRCAGAHAIEGSLPRTALRPALDRLLALAARERAEGRYLTGPLAVRTVAASEHHLAPTWRQDSVVFECISLEAAPWGRDALRPYAALLDGLGARPHLGLDVLATGSAGDLARQFPAFPAWQAALLALDPRGRFDNPAVDRLGLRSWRAGALREVRCAAS